MKQENINIKYEVFNYEELCNEDRELADKARQAEKESYSPYSHFKVGCAVRLSNKEIVTGANQENAAYPSGLCAERTALFKAGMKQAQQDGKALYVTAMAVSASDEKNNPATAYPCGACRQVMYESEQRNKRNVVCENAEKHGDCNGKHNDCQDNYTEFDGDIRILIVRKDNTVLQIKGAGNLLPLSFDLN